VSVAHLREMNDALLTRPDGFVGHRKLDRGRERRKVVFDNLDERSVDWATAEELAYASILADGIPIRLTGEDVQRGTFSHRHAAFRDQDTGALDIPLQRLPQARASFEIHNSPLSENATIGFEYGYNVQAPDRLVIWEAQYGDFINGAQVMLDQFVTSARAKWGQTPSLVLRLPHGYEGQGPEHSSARPERFLGAAADINLRLANCTTAAQYFHLLRRQMHRTVRKPLVVMTPKSLLRAKQARSPIEAFTSGSFQDYFLPTAVETPRWETDWTTTPSPHHPIGAKGVGESPNVGGVPAFSNAVNDAFAFLGAGHIQMPHDHWRTWAVAERLGLHK